MSFSRFAAIGILLLAGGTLVSCASSSSPLPPVGNNPAAVNFPGGSARIMFVQGSPNLNLTITNTDLYIDNKLVFSDFFYPYSIPNPIPPCPPCAQVVGPATPFIVLPVGVHDFRLVETNTTNVVFLDSQILLKSGQKIMLVAEGDAAYHTTQWAEWLLPTYATPAGIRATSVFNASPNIRANADFWYNCQAPATCSDGTHSGTALATGLTLGNAAAPTTSWKNNVLLKASTTGNYCFAAYFAGSAGPPLPAVNAAAGPPFAGIPGPGGTEDPRNAACTTTFEAVAPGSNNDFVIIDAPSVAPQVPANGPSAVIQIPDQNG